MGLDDTKPIYQLIGNSESVIASVAKHTLCKQFIHTYKYHTSNSQNSNNTESNSIESKANNTESNPIHNTQSDNNNIESKTK